MLSQLVVSLISQGQFEAAATAADKIAPGPLAAEAWHAIARAYSTRQRWAEALGAIDLALRHQPRSMPLRFERAVIAAELGQIDSALQDWDEITRESGDSPQIVLQVARTLHLNGRDADAEVRLQAGLLRWPTDAALHVQLANVRWLRGSGEESMLWLERAIADFPGELKLRLVAADLLRTAGCSERALAILYEGLRAAPESAAFLTSIGVVLDGLQRSAEALVYLRDAVTRAPRSVSARRNLMVTLLRVGEPVEALGLANELSPSAPEDQQLIAYRATALRMLGDPEYRQLHDYERLVRIYRPQPPAGFESISQFNRVFADELTQLHRWQQRPLEQSLRGGTQTANNLPGNNPVIAAFFEMLDAPIRDYIARLEPARDHPTDRRKRGAYRFSGSWSVRLRPGGFHLNHVHPMGWLSSAYYIDVPREQPQDGWLKFGEPDMPMPGCSPDHFVVPEPGMLVLFPSYLWHGTVPFQNGTQRLTAAFDVVPD